MPKVKISEYSSTANSNTDVASINIDEGCAPSGINNAIRAVMGHLKDFQTGAAGDAFNGATVGAHNGTVGATTPSTVAATTLTTSSTVTLLSGTANGVAYLNGSKVLTTGSALVFDGTNLGIGTTAPTSKLDIAFGNVTISNSTNSPYINFVENTTRSQSLARITMDQLSGTSGNLLFSTTTGGTLSERARIDSSGNLLVGLTSVFNGTTSPLQVSTGAANQVLSLRNTSATPYGIYAYYSAASPNNTSSEFLYCNDSGGLKMSVRSNGGIANYSANNVNLSDRREKTNFAPAKSYLDVICAIPVQTYNYIGQNMEDDDGLTLGIVAQDVQAVAPELVMESNWGTKEEPKMRLSIYQTDLQYALMKCIQEQQALIQSLTARLDAANL